MHSKNKPMHSEPERNTPPILPIHRANRSNINIQINFNVKEKASGGVFAGKKIDNLVEVGVGKHPGEEDKKVRRKISRDDGKEIERKKTKEKYEGTPEKGSTQKKQQRSKSTNAKRMKKSLINEQIKATQISNQTHLNVKVKPPPNKSSSPSPQKSRSMSQSSKKLLSRPKTSNKNLLGYGFTNAIIVKQRPLNATVKSTKSKQKLIANQTHAHTYKSKEEQIKIKQFMSDKKKKEKKEKEKHLKEEKLKKQKIQQQLKRVEIQRKANASKPFLTFSPKKYQPEPIYFGQEEGSFHQHENYDKLTHQAQNLIRVIDTIPSHNPSEELEQKGQIFSSGIKYKGKKSGKYLIRGFMEGTLNKNEFKKLKKSVIKIQSLFRGCLARKKFINQLTNEQGKIRSIKNKIQNNSKLYWGSQTDNSVINLQSYVSPRQSAQPQQKGYDSPINKKQLQQCTKNFYKAQDSQIQEGYSEQISSQESPNRYKIEIDQEMQLESDSKPKPLIKPIKFLKPKLQEQINAYPSPTTQINAHILKEIEDLKKKLNIQDEKFKILQQQNQNLKANIKMLSLRESRQIQESQQIQSNDSIQFFELRMPQKIQSPLNEQISDMKKKKMQLTLDEVKEHPVRIGQAGIDISSLKKQLQSFQCSPSHAKMQEALTEKLRKKNLDSLFHKKQLKIQQSYAKKAQIFDKMLHDHLFSPRTYNFKKNELSQKLLIQKSQIQQRLEQAKRVVGFIEDISSSDQSQSQEIHQNNKAKQQKSLQKQQNTNKLNSQSTHNQQTGQNDDGSIKNQQIIQIIQDKNTFKKKLPFVKGEEEQITEEQNRFNKYWTDDIDTIHQKTLEIHRRIDEALLAESDSHDSSSQYHSISSQYKSTEHPIEQYTIKQESIKKEQQQRQVEKEGQSKRFAAIFNNVDLQAFQQQKSDQYQNQAFDQYEPQPQLTTSNLVNILNKNEGSLSGGQEAQQTNKTVTSPIVIDNLSQDSDSKNNSQVYQIATGQLNNNSNTSNQSSHSQSQSQSQSRSQNLFISQQNNSSQLSKPFLKGFQTSLTFIKQFCIAICQYIRNSNHLKEYFQQNISLPLKYDCLQFIKAYRTTLANENQTTFNSYLRDYIYPFFRCISPKVHAISSQLFTEFMECYDRNNEYNPKWNDPQLSEQGKQLRQFYLISIIDAFNEALDYQRPCGIIGESFSWLQNWKSLKNYKTSKWNHNNSQNNSSTSHKRPSHSHSSQQYSGESDGQALPQQQQRLDQIFGTSIAKLIQWGSSLCGFIPQPITLEMESSQVININEEQTAQIRQTRMALMLEKGLLQDQQLMLECGQQITQVILSLSEKVIEEIFQQALHEIII